MELVDIKAAVTPLGERRVMGLGQQRVARHRLCPIIAPRSYRCTKRQGNRCGREQVGSLRSIQENFVVASERSEGAWATP